MEWPLEIVLFAIAHRIDLGLSIDTRPLLSLKKNTTDQDFLAEPYKKLYDDRKSYYDTLITAYARESNLDAHSDEVKIWVNQTINNLHIAGERLFNEYIKKRQKENEENVVTLSLDDNPLI